MDVSAVKQGVGRAEPECDCAVADRRRGGDVGELCESRVSMNRTGWLAVLALGLLGVGAAVALWRPSSKQPSCPPDQLRFVDAGVGPPLAVCGPSGSPGPAGAVLAMGGKLNLNTATEAELALLPGIGPSLARALAEARSKRPFASWEDVDAVPGVGAGKLEVLQRFGDLRP